jgi:MFS family permease
MSKSFVKDIQYYKFSLYGFFKNLTFFEPFLILFFLEKGLSFWQIGIVYSVREITRNIFEIPSGFIADALGRRKTLIISLLVYAGSFVVFYFSDSYTLILLAMIIFALGDAFRTGTNKAMIYDYITEKGWKNQKVHYYGHTRSWSQSGSALSSLIAAAIVIAFQNYTVIFLASVLPYLIDAAIVFSYPKNLEGKTHKLHAKKLLAAFKTTFKDLFVVFKNPKYWRAINLHSAHSGYHKAIKEYIQPLIIIVALGFPFLPNWTDEKREAIFIGIIYFIIYLLTAQASKISGKLSDKLKTPNKALFITLLTGLFAGACAGLGIMFGYEWFGIFMFLIVYLIENLRKPIGVAAVADQSDQSVMTTVLSVNSQAESFFAAIIAPILGLCADKIGLGESLIIVSGGMILLSITMYTFRRN